ncbi:MAG TPA: hypothetical protein VM784_08755 [Actinomycetota bacterium]|nr:hypothetical protein [Actinomycetota bacterium]
MPRFSRIRTLWVATLDRQMAEAEAITPRRRSRRPVGAGRLGGEDH